MNHCDRALAAMRGHKVDHIPFIGRIDLWYSFHHSRGTLPSQYQNASLWDILRDLGIGIFGFGAWSMSFYRLEHRNVEVIKEVDGGTTQTRYITPYGDLACRDTMSEELKDAAGSGARVEFPFKSAKDYDALKFLIDNTEVVNNFDAYGKFVDDIGEDGIALPFSGHLPAHQLMLNYMGYEKFYLELFDNQSLLEGLVESLTEQQTQIIDLAAKCPATAIEVGGNYDESMTPPPIFERYFAPFYRTVKSTFSKAGKILVVHGDGEMKGLLTSLMDCGIDVVEALTPKPMTTIDIASTRKLWNDKVAIWGGLATIVLTDVFSEEKFESFLVDLFSAVAPGERFILGFGDNVPTDASFSRIQRVAEFWRENGGFPLPG